MDIERLVEALTQLAHRGTVLDPDVVAHLLGRRSARERVQGLSPREHDVLALMAAGHSNSAMARKLGLTDKTIESHISNILNKLDLPPEVDAHRRVLAVLAWMGSA